MVSSWCWLSVWFLVGNGGMGYGDYIWGLYRDYYRDPFPHSLLRTRQLLWMSSPSSWPFCSQWWTWWSWRSCLAWSSFSSWCSIAVWGSTAINSFSLRVFSRRMWEFQQGNFRQQNSTSLATRAANSKKPSEYKKIHIQKPPGIRCRCFSP